MRKFFWSDIPHFSIPSLTNFAYKFVFSASHKPKENEAKTVEVNKRDLDNGSFELSDDDDIFMLSRSQSKRSKKSKKKKSRIDEDVAELLYTPKISSSARSIVEAKKFQTFQTWYCIL